MRVLPLVALVTLLLPALASAFDYDAYKPMDLERAAPNLSQRPGGKTYHLDAAHPRYSSIVTFTGNIRPLTDDVRSLVNQWVAAMRHPQSYRELFQFEIEVVQDSRHYWMPIQQQLADAFKEEVAPRSLVKVYVLLLGGIDRTPVFAVSGFVAETPDQTRQPTRVDKPLVATQLQR